MERWQRWYVETIVNVWLLSRKLIRFKGLGQCCGLLMAHGSLRMTALLFFCIWCFIFYERCVTKTERCKISISVPWFITSLSLSCEYWEFLLTISFIVISTINFVWWVTALHSRPNFNNENFYLVNGRRERNKWKKLLCAKMTFIYLKP